jgi:hypothetical protein
MSGYLITYHALLFSALIILLPLELISHQQAVSKMIIFP